jgi:hypothetical protein
MDVERLRRFDLVYPGIWLSGVDPETAFQTCLILGYIEDAFIEAVAACAMFEPLTYEKARKSRDLSRYENCLNSIYAKSFVYSLAAIGKLFNKLRNRSDTPPGLAYLCRQYEDRFGHTKHIRDSSMHIEDRGVGLDRRGRHIHATVLVLGGFIGESSATRLCFTGEDGNQYEVKISEAVLSTIHPILQGAINSYRWE